MQLKNIGVDIPPPTSIESIEQRMKSLGIWRIVLLICAFPITGLAYYLGSLVIVENPTLRLAWPIGSAVIIFVCFLIAFVLANSAYAAYRNAVKTYQELTKEIHQAESEKRIPV